MRKITIVVPCYNVEKYIEKTIQSFRQQTFKDFEVIFVDDCSTDNSVDVISTLMHRYNISGFVTKNKCNSGPSITRKNGVELSTSEYLAFCDSDDWLDSDYLEQLYGATRCGECDIAFCNYRVVYENGKSFEKTVVTKIIESLDEKERLTIDIDGLWTGIYRRSLFDNLVFPDIRNGEDMAIIPVLISKANNIGITDKCIYNYLQRTGSLSTTQTEKLVNSICISFAYINENCDKTNYYHEIEYLGMRNLLYGAFLNLFKQGYNTKEAKDILADFENSYPEWRKNQYLGKLPRYKRIYLWCIDKRLFVGAWFLSALHTFMTK